MPLYNSQASLVKQLDDALKRIKALELRGTGGRGTGVVAGPETPGLDTTPPVVTTQPARVVGRDVTITVVANEPVSGSLKFGTTPENLSLTRTSTGGVVQTLTFVLNALAPNTTYYATVTTTDVAGNSTITALSPFTTADDSSAGSAIYVSSGPNVSSQSTTATVSFTTNVAATSRIDYRVQGSSAAFVTVYQLGAPSTSHLVALTDLQAGTSYQTNVYLGADSSSIGTSPASSLVFTTQSVDVNGVSVSQVSAVPAASGGVNVSTVVQSARTLTFKQVVISIRNATTNAASDATYGTYDTGGSPNVLLNANVPLQVSGFKLLGPGSYVAFFSYQLSTDAAGTWYTSTSTPFTLTTTPTNTTPEPTPVAKTPPTVSFTSTVSSLTANFRANATDADGTVVGYDWDFGDAAGSRNSAPTHVYSAAGTYTVSVTAIDNDGYASQSTQQVVVTDPDPITSIPAGLSKPAIFYSPHSDDQILSLGVGIIEHIAAGRNVIVVLMTEGASAYMQTVINGTASTIYGYSHNPTLENYKDQPSGGSVPLAAITYSRRMEFLSSIGRLSAYAGAGRVYTATMKYPEGLTVATVKSVMQRFESRWPGASHKTMSYNDSHPDHAACGQALQQLASAGTVSDARYYVKLEDEKNANITALAPFYSYPADATQTKVFQDGCRPHMAWNPAAGAYAFGYQSVNTTFDTVMASPRSLQHK